MNQEISTPTSIKSTDEHIRGSGTHIKIVAEEPEQALNNAHNLLLEEGYEVSDGAVVHDRTGTYSEVVLSRSLEPAIRQRLRLSKLGLAIVGTSLV
jgi:hypothetical protein